MSKGKGIGIYNPSLWQRLNSFVLKMYALSKLYNELKIVSYFLERSIQKYISHIFTECLEKTVLLILHMETS